MKVFVSRIRETKTTPKALKQLPNLTLAVGVTESVALTGLFAGMDVTLTATASNTQKVTVQVNRGQTSMGVIPIAAGIATVTVTATNTAGTTSVTFTVTVSHPTDADMPPL